MTRWLDDPTAGSVLNSFYSHRDEQTLRLLTGERFEWLAWIYAREPFGRAARIAAGRLRKSRARHAWIGQTLGFVERMLRRHPPCDENWRVRKDVLLLLDLPLHVEGGRAWQQEVERFCLRGVARAARQMARLSAVRGLRIRKLYNMGFAVRSPSAAVGFDVSHGRALPFPKRIRRALAQRLDVALVTHRHPDHASSEFLQDMLALGKTVVLPPDACPELEHANLVRLRRRSQKPLRIGPVTIYSYPGDQQIPNNVYVVRVDGHCLSHNGDNTAHEVYAELARHRVDVAMTNCWSGMASYAAATGPRLLITGHENELSHAVQQRLGYIRTFDNLGMMGLAPPWRKSEPQVAMLGWGEGIQWSRTRGIAPAEPGNH